MEKINVEFKGQSYQTSALTTPMELMTQFSLKVKNPVAAVINGRLEQLTRKMTVDTKLDIIERDTYHGQKIYESSLIFLFVVAFRKVFPHLNVFIQHSIQQGIYAEVRNGSLSDEEVKTLENMMRQMVEKQMPINLITRDWDVALSRMKGNDRTDLMNLYRYYSPSEIKMYELSGIEEGQYQPLLPNSGMIQEFELKSYEEGVAILMPDYEKNKKSSEFKHNPKLFNTYKEYHGWCRVLKVRTVGQLNQYIMNGEISDYIKVAEALHEKKVAAIADMITHRHFTPRVILIAGPSSSGKTTFSKRLAIQLRVNGFKPLAISLDDYFVDREKTPKDENGDYDFEVLEAINYELFQSHLNDLLSGKEIELPKFDFKTGRSSPSGRKLLLEDDQLIIVEGIHGINPKLTDSVDQKHKFKIYISPLTQLNLHRHDRVPSSDTRVLRRIVRDSLFRGYRAHDTLKQWKSVRAGENKNIFPFQESADVIFNSALFYELSVLKLFAERELLRVPREHFMYAESQRLLKFLSYFLPLESEVAPRNSILKEFIGGSSFEY